MTNKKRKEERRAIMGRHPEQIRRFELPYVECRWCEHLKTKDDGDGAFWKREWRCAALDALLHIQIPGETLPTGIGAPAECPKRERKKDNAPMPLP